jgi:hydroxymethylbilane synthase
MSFKTLTIATRQSPLALKQTEMVKGELFTLQTDLSIDTLPLKTTGDTFLETRLNKIGGKGLFTKELELAMLDNKAQLAVHSMKDLPSVFPAGLVLAAILKREDPRDAFVSEKYNSFETLPEGALIGTSSLRRECQLRALRPDLVVKPLRGNINTRLKKACEFDAIILAAAGLKRMGFESSIKAYFEPTVLLPAAGQGALGIEALENQEDVIQFVAKLASPETTACVKAERALIHRLDGGCQVPIAAYCQLEQSQMLVLNALVGSTDGKTLIQSKGSASIEEAEVLGQRVADELIKQGAKTLLDTYR